MSTGPLAMPVRIDVEAGVGVKPYASVAAMWTKSSYSVVVST